MKVADFDYNLPEDRIAQQPADQRDQSRLMVIHRDTNIREHRHFFDLPQYLKPGDCLVLNDSKVLPARLFGKKRATGAHIELLLTQETQPNQWLCLAKPGKRLKPGDKVDIGPDFYGEVTALAEQGLRKVTFHYRGIFLEKLYEYGKMPLPPYIQRQTGERDRQRYQTVYSKDYGSVAAPTAGLHFTKDLLKKIEEKGVHLAYVTLHVGLGTFRPVKTKQVTDHQMHWERYEINEDNARIINDAKRKGGRIIAVGTTATRTLESSNEKGRVLPGVGSTDIFIYPGYSFSVIDSQLTNFHLPQSTLLMLISAFYQRKEVLEAYEEAIQRGYRFFSYGDAMLLL